MFLLRNRMIILSLLLVVAWTSAVRAAGSGSLAGSYDLGNDFLPATPSVTGGAVGAFFNPAAWATVGRAETALWWDDRNLRSDALDNWGLSRGGPLGFSVMKRTGIAGGRTESVYDYQVGFAAGDRRHHLGMSWKWSGGATRAGRRASGLALGAVERLDPHVSFGASGFFRNGVDLREGIFDVGVRPFALPRLTLFADYAVREGETWTGGAWGLGAAVRPTPGLELGLRFRDPRPGEDVRFSFNLGLTFDEVAVHAQPRFSDGGDRVATSYLVRVNPPHRGFPVRRVIRDQSPPRRVVVIDLENRVLAYGKDRWFDDTHVAWIDLLRHLEAIGREPSVRGVALNLAGFRARPSLTWELRRKLVDLQSRGKAVYIHADRLGMNGYYLASVADRLSLDPLGQLQLPGVALHRTYMAGLLQKLGLGAEEWRYFSHKTAFQTLVRRTMSEADREQLGRVADVLYETWREGICTGRNLDYAEFDHVVNDLVQVPPRTAVETRLVDVVGRWDGLLDWIKEDKGLEPGPLPEDPARRVLPDERWGRPPEIALVYAVGECAMDTGIRGRATSQYLRELSRRHDVAAVVLRADSPGGDPLPSDLVAEGVRKLRDAGKPVVVSQGDVAASGGYWISMDGDHVLTTPVTVTGSIGIIAGWVWDDGLGEKTGFSADGVQRGDHADLFTGIRFPVFGGPLPERNLTAGEKETVRTRILGLYDEFVNRVAEGRGLDPATVRRLAEGRIWMGEDAIERGLCDGFGGIEEAVAEAKRRAGIGPEEEVILTEFPQRKLFSLPALVPEIPGVSLLARWMRGTPIPVEASPAAEAFSDYGWTYLQALAAHPARPLLLTPPEWIPGGWW